ncbi:hypothetical protein [Sphingomonas sp. PAMC 26617]|uniref:hypothetical protein n=1 Tax=Sphingomonas sp. PAMC 26617 TaxID=1112216 RepID=UPI00028A374F|nr:hypothetical protein [Sphingomonas sp. PAMC 26617]
MRGPSIWYVGLGFALTSTTVGAAPAPRFKAVVLPMQAEPSVEGIGSPMEAATMPVRPGAMRTVLTDPARETALGHQPRQVPYDLRVAKRDDGSLGTSLKRRLRPRGSGTRDAYLDGDSGLRVSVGSSYHMSYRATSRMAGSRMAARRGSSAVNLRDGYEGYAPVALAGYDRFVSDRMKIGVEGGMMVGRSTAMYADETMPGAGSAERTARNPVADVVMTYAF